MNVGRILIVLLAGFFFSYCGKSSGSFAFHAVNDQNFTEFQKKVYSPREFKKYHDPILFNENQHLWFSYEPAKVEYKIPYAVSLSKKSLGWIEIDLKNVHLSRNIGYLVDSYPDLKFGKYKLTVALKDKILNSIEFEILKEGDQKDDFIDYDMPLSILMDSDADDLRALSRE